MSKVFEKEIYSNKNDSMTPQVCVIPHKNNKTIKKFVNGKERNDWGLENYWEIIRV